MDRAVECGDVAVWQGVVGGGGAFRDVCTSYMYTLVYMHMYICIHAYKKNMYICVCLHVYTVWTVTHTSGPCMRVRAHLGAPYLRCGEGSAADLREARGRSGDGGRVLPSEDRQGYV